MGHISCSFSCIVGGRVTYCNKPLITLQNYFCTTLKVLNNFDFPTTSQFEARGHNSLLLCSQDPFYSQVTSLRHGPHSGHHFVRVYGRTLTMGISSAILTCPEAILSCKI
jgi:hypothetical protein